MSYGQNSRRSSGASRSWSPDGKGHAIYTLYKFGETQRAVHVGREKTDRESMKSFWLPISQCRIISDIANRHGNTIEISIPEWLAKRNDLCPHRDGRGYGGQAPAPTPYNAPTIEDVPVMDRRDLDDPGFAPYPDDYSGRDYDPGPPDGYVPMEYDPTEDPADD